MDQTVTALPSIGGATASITYNGPQEVVPGRLFRLGGTIPLDGRVSWAPEEPGRFQSLNCYVLTYEDRAFLIDTGVAAMRKGILRQLDEIVPRSMPLTCFLTRPDYQCIGNLHAVYLHRGIDELPFGLRSPFAAFSDVSRDIEVKQTLLSLRSDRYTPLPETDDLIVFPALFKLLGTVWVYCRSTKTLFSSDAFSYTTLAAAAASAVLDDLSQDSSTPQSALSHLVCRHHWLKKAMPKSIQVWLEKIFSELEVEIIAPGFGCVLKGKLLVHRHYELLQGLLGDFGRSSAKLLKDRDQ